MIMDSTAIIMAGGGSGRMGEDKSLLDVGGKPMIKHIFDQLAPEFSQVLISANDLEKYAFLGAEVVADRAAGHGPLMGIVSCLERSENDVNFVVACDIPSIDIELVKSLVAESTDFDAVVPKNPDGRFEPLFAVYRKSMLGVFNDLLSRGERKIDVAYDLCKVKYHLLDAGEALKNINTAADYKGLLEDLPH